MKIGRLKYGVLIAAAFIAGASCGGNESPTDPSPVCTFSITPASSSFGSAGGTASVTVTAAAGCAWSASASAAWIAIASGTAGTGPGTVTYSVAGNAADQSRNGTLTIAGITHAVSQEGRAPTVCNYALSPSAGDFGKDAATGTFAVAAPAGCAWTAASQVPWLTIAAGQSGSGDGVVSYSVARNVELGARTGTIGVADRVFTVRQAGDAGLCQYSVAPVDFRPCMAGGTLTATVTTQANCQWTAASNVPWLAVASGASGAGTGTIVFTFSDNYDPPRDGIVMVRWPTPTAGQNVRVAQAGCFYAVSRSDFSVAATGGSGTFDVIQRSEPNTCGGATQDRCVWTAVSNVPWITITSSMPRAGDNPVAFSVADNPGTASRAGRITVRDKVVTITQAGR